MKKIEPYKNINEATLSLDNGGRFYNVLTKSDDGIISTSELGKVAGLFIDKQKMVLFLDLAISNFDVNAKEKIVNSLDASLRSTYEKYKSHGFGYYEIQKTKPQTVGYGLNDSPVGLAAWIVEKFYGWFDGEENKLVVSNDEVLAIISLYWFTETITSSARLYKENGDLGFSFEKISQPMAGAVFKRDLVAPPRAWAEKIYNIIQWNLHDGGHFAALEKPETLSSDIINFIQKLDIV